MADVKTGKGIRSTTLDGVKNEILGKRFRNQKAEASLESFIFGPVKDLAAGFGVALLMKKFGNKEKGVNDGSNIVG